MFGKKNREIQDLKWVIHSLEKTVEELKEERYRLEIENEGLRDRVKNMEVGRTFIQDWQANPCIDCQYYNKPWFSVVSPCTNCPKKSNLATGGYVTVTSTSVNVEKE